MVTLGVDLASLPGGTAACRIRWADGRADVGVPEANITDAWLLEHAAEADRVGVDVPFGWPEAFVRAVAAHHGGSSWPASDLAALCYRATDRFVREQTGRRPLSVATERLGVVAMRAAALLSQVTAREGLPVDRTGRGRWLEVYPAIALLRWELPASGYKRPKRREIRRELMRRLETQAGGWLTLSSEVRERCVADDNSLDALVTSLVARAAALGLCEPVPVAMAAVAAQEGWIALPKTGSLQALA